MPSWSGVAPAVFSVLSLAQYGRSGLEGWRCRIWQGSGTEFGPELVQDLSQNWYRICTRTGPGFGTELAQDLARNRSRVWHRTGPVLGSELVQDLAQNWYRIWHRTGHGNAQDPAPGAGTLGFACTNFVTGFHIKKPPRYRKSTSSRTGIGPVPGQELDQFRDRNWHSSGTGTGPVPGQDLARIWDRIWPRSGTGFGPDLGPDLARFWDQI